MSINPNHQNGFAMLSFAVPVRMTHQAEKDIGTTGSKRERERLLIISNTTNRTGLLSN